MTNSERKMLPCPNCGKEVATYTPDILYVGPIHIVRPKKPVIMHCNACSFRIRWIAFTEALNSREDIG